MPTHHPPSPDRRPWQTCLNSLLLMLLAGCSTNPGALHLAHHQFINGDNNAALSTLANIDVVAPKDRLLFRMEKALFLHDAGDFEESTRQLLAASKYLEQNDYISLRDETSELLTNEWAGRYQGEYSEQLWIHSYLMINFLSQGLYESAAVEARQALSRIEDQPEVLENDHFTRALIALSFEAAGQLNDAYIEYRKLVEEKSTYGKSLNAIMLPQALRLGVTDNTHNLIQQLQDTRPQLSVADLSTQDYAVFFIASGLVPRKYSSSILIGSSSRLSFPQYDVSNAEPPKLHVTVNGELCDCHPIHTDLGLLVSDSLNKRGIKLATKSLIRAYTKDAVADAIGNKEKTTGELVRLLFFALEEADTRSWQSLPRHLTLLRIPLPKNDAEPVIEISASASSGSIIKTLEPAANKRGLQFFPLRLISRY